MKSCLTSWLALPCLSLALGFAESALADSTVVFNEIMYHPASNESSLEWLELHNQMAVDMDLSAWSLEGGVQFAFPEGTILAMEVLTPGSQSSINRHGQFEDRFVGVEAAVKDSSRFPEGWAYFNFIRRGQPAAPTAKAFPKEACWECHNKHGQVDNVFTQFYPVLRRNGTQR